MIYQDEFSIATAGRDTHDITKEVATIVNKANIKTGICQVFNQHTSASLMLCENYDPVVRSDLETFMSRTIPDGDPIFKHTMEGPDDMPAHVRTVLTHSSLSIPVSDSKLHLGTWQGIFLWEHRHHGHQRTIVVTVMGE